MTLPGLIAIIIACVFFFIAGAKLMSDHDRDLIAAQPAPIIHNTATATVNGGGSGGIGVGSKIVLGLIAAVFILASINAMIGQGNQITNKTPVQVVATQAMPQQYPTVAVPTPVVIPTVRPVEVPQQIPQRVPEYVPVYADQSWMVPVIGVLVLCIAIVGIGTALLVVHNRHEKEPIIGLPMPSSLAVRKPDAEQPIDMDVWGGVVEKAVDDLERDRQ